MNDVVVYDTTSVFPNVSGVEKKRENEKKRLSKKRKTRKNKLTKKRKH